ncbi:hypothetical protein [Rhizobium binxianense]
MLTPVRVASNASFSSQGQTAAIVAGGLGRSVVAAAPVSPVESSDLNSAIAGKLNILLIAARERMVDALFDVIDAAGRAISLRRGDDETSLAYAARLAGAIQRLPEAAIAEAERELAEQGHNLPLRVIAEALRNPAGPEVARIVAYLEMVRYKDRDLAARAVVRSYRQNDASPIRAEAKPEILLHEDSLPAAARQETPVAKAPVAAPAGRDVPAPVGVSPAITEAEIAETLEAEEPESETPFQPVVTAEEDAPAEGGEPEAAEDPKATALPAGDRADDAPEIPEAPAPSSPPAGRPDPVIPRNWSGILASMTEETSELIVTIIRGQETVAVPLEDDPLDAAVEIDAMLDEAVIGDLTDIPVRQPAELAGSTARPAAAGLPPAPANVAAAAAGVLEAEAPVRQPIPAPEPGEAPHALQAARMPDGVAYVPLPYHFARDALPAGKAEKMHRPYDGDRGEEERQQAGSGEDDAGAQAGSEEPDGEASPQRDARDAEPASVPGAPVADPLYALYQRMAGWE